MEGAPEPLTVLYDTSCGLCRRLAEYGRVRSNGALLFVPWQEFSQQGAARSLFSEEERATAPRCLRTLREGEVLENAEAWAAILTAYPPFQSLTWIAERLGLMGSVSRATFHGSQWLRGHCNDCP
ncbi:MAG: DUF393 domain-containing protein [Candidatus Hydrogenedentes bacterium]|nr:DUF393 domain-containing protein [Candidatus Hydrogenedentota bacterium]